MRFALLLCLLSTASVGATETQRALLPLTINESDRGTLLALLSDDDVLLRVVDLTAAGVSGFGGRRHTMDGDEFVSLASLSSDARFELDSQSVSLELTVPPTWLAATVLDMSPTRPKGILYSEDTSGFVNYALTNHGSAGSDAFLEGGLSVRGDLLYSSVSYATNGEVARGLTSYTHDDREHLRRWVVGDTFAAAGGLGGALFLGGFSFSKNFDLDPYFVRTPTMAVSGAVTTPSTIDVYVNGSIVRRQQIPAGTFDIRGLGLPSGSGNAQFVVRDAFGNERTLSNPFYASSELLAKGLNEYSVNVGLRRDRIGPEGDGYGPPALLARQRYGWTDRLTAGFRLEADEDVQSVGETLALRLPFGEIGMEIAASRDRGLAGSAGAFTFRHLGRVVNYGVFVKAQSNLYSNLTLRAAQDRPTLEGNAFAGFTVGRRTSLTAQYDLAEMRDAPRIQRLTLSSTVSLSSRFNLVLSGGAAEIDRVSGFEGFVGLSCFLGRGNTASISQRVVQSRGRAAIDVQKSLPLGTGFGYRVGGFAGDDQDGFAGAIQYQSAFGRYEARYDRVNDSGSTTLSVSGGLVALGGTMAFTQPVGESFALIRVPGVSGITGLSSNQPIARTNRRGDVIVPNLMPYYGNRIGILDQDLPLDYEVGSTEKTVAPPYRGGAVVTFSAQKARSVRGEIVFDATEGSYPATYGDLTVETAGVRYESPIGGAGEFELANLPLGRHTLVVKAQNGACGLTIDVPATDIPIVILDALHCRLEEGQ